MEEVVSPPGLHTNCVPILEEAVSKTESLPHTVTDPAGEIVAVGRGFTTMVLNTGADEPKLLVAIKRAVNVPAFAYTTLGFCCVLLGGVPPVSSHE